ncbi:hypothetical protein JKF63_06825 [Porcisia hertigi]|uniref:USP domain-containing protein n=1 Tax=Porcisia hertigi TaxID=2761500 RepID=A0A837A928_9TRYP|nr:hypothetical protein JKF63_06825 [Porcisia hertigi]
MDESTTSFCTETAEVVEMHCVEDAVTSTDAALSAPHGSTTAISASSTLPTEAASQTNVNSTAFRAVARGIDQTPPNASPTPGGVTSSVATSAHTVATTPSVGSSHMVAWEDTHASQRLSEEQVSPGEDFNPMVLCPLQNLGNTCYFNAGVQLLVNCPALVYALRNSPPAGRRRSHSPLVVHTSQMPPDAASAATAKLHPKGGPATHALFVEFADLLDRMEAGCSVNERAISPLAALDALARVYPQFEGRSQQDAAEMMTSLLASLEEEGGQYVEVAQLLQSFEEDAVALRQGTSLLASSNHPAVPAAIGATAPHWRDRSEPYSAERYSQPSPITVDTGDITLPGPRSANFFAVLRLMDQVNRENEVLERRVKQRRGIPYTGSFKPPRLHFNPLLDGFRGYMFSQVKCHSCNAVSRVVSAFNGLLLDVPSVKQRRNYAIAHPDVPRRVYMDWQPQQVKKPFRLSWWNPVSLCVVVWNRLKRFFQDPLPYPLWLDECLDIHFEPEVLQGSNKYRCESCGATTEATKSESLLSLPEYLIVHMKRFEAGRFFNSKKDDSVLFPVSWSPLTEKQANQSPAMGKGKTQPLLPEYLDLRRYLHRSVAHFAEPLPPCLAGTDTDTKPHAPHLTNKGGASSCTCSIPTTYTLDGIINHHGGYDGGHYTVFLHKATEAQQAWVYISDDEVARADDVVATDTEYVFMYRRQPLVKRTPESNEAEQLRRKARYYLSPSHSPFSGASVAAAATADPVTCNAHSMSSLSSSSMEPVAGASLRGTAVPCVYISRMWLQRVVFMHEPGPIVNRLCYCRPEDRERVSMYQTLFPTTVKVPAEVPHIHGPPVDWFYVPITQKDYDIFYKAFGGNSAVTASEYESLRATQKKFCADIDMAERHRQRSNTNRSVTRR